MLHWRTHGRVPSIGPLDAELSRHQTRGGNGGTSDSGEVCPDASVRYAPPAVLWEEDYEVVHLGLTCVKFEGADECLPGPLSW